MAVLSFKTITETLVAGTIAIIAVGGIALADNAGKPFDPTQARERIEKRIDRALAGTDATVDQKRQIVDILKNSAQPILGICLSDAVRQVRAEVVARKSNTSVTSPTEPRRARKVS